MGRECFFILVIAREEHPSLVLVTAAVHHYAIGLRIISTLHRLAASLQPQPQQPKCESAAQQATSPARTHHITAPAVHTSLTPPLRAIAAPHHHNVASPPQREERHQGLLLRPGQGPQWYALPSTALHLSPAPEHPD